VKWEKQEKDPYQPEDDERDSLEDDEKYWSDEHEEEEEEEEWDPNDPSHPDHDLSEAAGYGARDYHESQAFPPPALVYVVSLLLVAAMLAPLIMRFLR
jgi:hypothetical protein